MDFFCFFLVLGSIFGCFPAKLRFILGRKPLEPLKYRHYIVSIVFMLLQLFQTLEFVTHCIEMQFDLSTSEKISMAIAAITYLISDVYFRLYGIIYGHRLSMLIRDLRGVKAKLGGISGICGDVASVRRLDRRWFTIGVALGLALQYVHVPLRVFEWYSHRGIELEWRFYPSNPIILYPLLFLCEVGGIVCRSFALAIIVCIGLELLESYELLNTVAEKCTNRVCSKDDLEEQSSKSNKSLLMDKHLDGETSESSEKVLLEQFFEVQSCFRRFNHILGSYAFVILTWATGNLTMEIRALPSGQGGEGKFGYSEPTVTNKIANIMGTLFGFVVTYLICLLGHRMEYAVRKHKDKMKFLRLESPDLHRGKVYACLSKFKWEFTAKGLFTINLSLIPRIAGAIFSITIFHLQLEISEKQCPMNGESLKSSSPSLLPQSIYTTIVPY